MWVARNLKFHSLALRRAAENEPSLAHVAAHFRIRLCTGKEKLFAECDTWELLNLAPDEAVSLTTRISETFGLSTPALQAVLNNYLIQTTGKDDLEKHFGIEQPPQYLCRRTTHYSWAKGTASEAITGIGSTNITRVPVDEQARIDCQALDTLLTECVKHHRAMYAIVVNMGTTEHGSVDPLSEILALRRKYQQQGLSFLIHASAAWGGYFTSMLVPNPDLTGSESHQDDPTLFVNAHTVNELRHLRHADSPTRVATHTVPLRCPMLPRRSTEVHGHLEQSCHRLRGLEYGCLWYRGKQTRCSTCGCVAWSRVIGLHIGGFGYLLGQSVFTSTKMYGHWATMSLDHPNLLVVPF
ncbi:pyridoxal phosphate-dependent transferase [Lactarius hengduanensis]|nr:pyridoxal phosphate-dependent transferase [Lactarius hengduanensis]